jgi:2-polyprenyl-3-methyl-5-hydroxy-6-metoxy-1,4-benzoquinol methylase
MKTEQEILNFWLDEKECKKLQKGWGDYDEFIKKPNMENKVEVIKLLQETLSQKLSLNANVLEVGCGAGQFEDIVKN